MMLFSVIKNIKKLKNEQYLLSYFEQTTKTSQQKEKCNLYLF